MSWLQLINPKWLSAGAALALIIFGAGARADDALGCKALA
jgi:hypothetical protein